MPSIKESFKDQDIPFGEGRVAKAGTRLHSMLVGDMVREAEEAQSEKEKSYTLSLATALTSIEGLSEDEFVEGFVIRKLDSGDFTVDAVDDQRKIVLKKRIVIRNKAEEGKDSAKSKS
tara:strand:- start:6581 stop:6934 length:354 start_codon:yes stop_codon:yes gene_type:complete